MTHRLFLVTPDDLPESMLRSCAMAASQAADCASILVRGSISQHTVAALQQQNLAVLLRDAEPRLVHHFKADGLQLSNVEDLKEARAVLKDHSLGFLAGTSRHAAMEAAEAGADYIAFHQSAQVGGEPIIAWWQDVTGIPAVAYDPVDQAGLSSLLPQKPDFIRPMDEMWMSEEMARRTVQSLMAANT